MGPCRAKLTKADVAAIRSSEGVSQRSLARMFGVSQTTVYYVLANKTWRHVG